MPPEFQLADYLGFLTDLGKAGEPYFLEGGQAVNFWAEYFSAKGKRSGLDRLRPFTSKDCDIWVSLAVLRYLETRSDQGASAADRDLVSGQGG
jgi:hypothetical protein